MSNVKNQKLSLNITAKVGRPSYLNLNFLTKGLTDLLRSKTERSLRPTTTERQLQQQGLENTSIKHLFSKSSLIALTAQQILGYLTHFCCF